MATNDAAIGALPPDWAKALGAAASPQALAGISAYVAKERRISSVLPSPHLVFAALEATPLASVRAVILGQDPYPTQGHADGMAFSVPDGVRPLPQSLVNIRKELRSDLAIALPESGSLATWARHGVLLLNTALTVREGVPHSHRRAGWQTLTDAIIAAVAARDDPIAFLLWGRPAQAKAHLLGGTRHVVVMTSHPSPLAAYRGFIGSRPFSTANDALESIGQARILWSLS